MKDDLSVVGKRLPRWDAAAKATGAAKYAADIQLPGMLIGKVLTSPHAHARILNIDTSKAENLPGVEAVITYADVPHNLYNPNKLNYILPHPETELKDMYVLSDKARYVGDRIAAVAAVDAATADKAVKLIEVKYEVLPAVFDALEAMKPGAPQIHDFAKNNISLHMKFPIAWGDVGKGFEEADVVVEETFHTARNHIAQLEPCACVVDFSSDGRLTIWSGSQHPFLHRRKIAEIFGLPEGMIKWITPHVGGGFGKLGSIAVEPVCVALAMKAGKPVKIEYTREEDFICTELRQRFIAKTKMGFKKNGAITAIQEEMIVDGGAYFTHNSSTTGAEMGGFTGLYHCPSVAAEASCVYTNLPVTGGVRGYGDSEGTCMVEQLMDRAASKLGIDPLEIRLKNVKKAGDPSSCGLPMETCSLEEMMRLGAEKIGWKEKRAANKSEGPKKRGIGMGIMMDVSGAQPFDIQHRNVAIKFNEDGSVNLSFSSVDVGQNLHGTMAQMAAEILGIPYEDVHIQTGDTDINLYDTGQHASGGCYQVGQAVVIAAEDAKKALLERAAKKLDAAVGELEARDRRVYVVSDPEKSISIAEIAKDAIYNFEGQHSNISGKGSFSATKNPPPFAAVFAEVEVDVETGEVKVLKILYIFDCGKAINPATVEGQLEGGVAQSIGYVLSEDYMVNKKTGAVMTDNFTTYRLAGTLDMPDMEVVLYEELVPSGPFGAKGAGHSTMIAVTPAIVNAIYDAVGVFITDMPATPEKILKALKDQQR
jgi:xanthine dehydrogenase molybdenum-binding subunit